MPKAMRNRAIIRNPSVAHEFTAEAHQKLAAAIKMRTQAIAARRREVSRLSAEAGSLKDYSTGKSLGMTQKDFTRKKIRHSQGVLRDAGVSPGKISAISQQARTVSSARSRANYWSEEMGMIAARDIAGSRGESILVGAEEYDDHHIKGKPWQARGRDSLDVVSVSADGTRLIVYEAKGGAADPRRWYERFKPRRTGSAAIAQLLEHRRVPTHDRPHDELTRVQQGSREYLQDVIQKDELLHQRLAAGGHDKLLEDLLAGRADVEYHVVQGTDDGEFQHFQFDIGPAPLGLPGSEPPPSWRDRPGGPPAAARTPRSRGKSAPVSRVRNLGGSALVVAALAGGFGAASMSGPAAPSASAAAVQQAAGDMARPNPALFAGQPAGHKSLADAAKSISDSMRKSTDAAGSATSASKSLLDEAKSSTAGSKSMFSLVGRVAGVLKNASAVMLVMTIAQHAFNLVMRANPFGAIATAIGLAVIGIVLLVENWDKVKLAFQWVYEHVLIPLGQWFSSVWKENIVPILATCVNAVKGFFEGISSSIHSLWDKAVDAFKWYLRMVADALDWLPDFIVGDLPDKIRKFTDPEKRKDGGLLGGVLDGRSGPDFDVVSTVSALKGEFIVDAASERINSGAVPRFVDGGLVSYSSWSEWAGGSAQSAANGFFFGSDEVPSGDKRPGGVAGDLIGGMAGLAGAAGSFASGMIGDALGVFGADGVPPLVQGLVLANNELVAHEKRITDAKITATQGNPVPPGSSDQPGDDDSDAPVGDAVALPFAVLTSNLRKFARGDLDQWAAGGSSLDLRAGVDGLVPVRLSDGEFVVKAEAAAVNMSLLEAINQDANAVSSLLSAAVVPVGALPGAATGRQRRVDRSVSLHISSPDVDAEFSQDRAAVAQRALTYAGRWN
ncbi:hypothetical protein ACIA5E_13390 [Nocardia asteroides]|uniref:hypothetical protein n=1 Tax=Nocardia asteroides TaxID=1824 RepID=UPI00379940E7